MKADLDEAVQTVMESGQLDTWLEAMASNGLTRWSASNRMLAMMQMNARGKSVDGLHLMGFKQWKNYDRSVTKGAQAVWILAPVTKTFTDEDDDGTEIKRRQVVGFKPVPVFDVSDTDGEPMPPSPVAASTEIGGPLEVNAEAVLPFKGWNVSGQAIRGSSSNGDGALLVDVDAAMFKGSVTSDQTAPACSQP